MKTNVKRIKSEIISTVILAVVLVIILFFVSLEQNNKAQYLDGLDYNVTINEDGSIKIIETWDVYISRTNTLFRNFDYGDYRKYGDIVDVKVKDLTTNIELIDSHEEQYHVDTGYFYALEIMGNKFEIAWGTGMEDRTGYKKYQVEYTITDVVSEYNDCQEVYWMLLSSESAIPAKKVTGTIKLPKEVRDVENLKVWGHGDINGKINVVSKDTVKFEVDSLNPYSMLEVRVAMLDKVVNVQNAERIQNYDLLPQALREEQNWAIETNINIGVYRTIIMWVLIIYAVILAYNIFRLVQARKISKKGKIKVEKLQYYRDIPRGKSSTAGEAAYLHYFNKSSFQKEAHQSDMVAATILNLCLKKHIALRTQNTDIYVKILTNGENLKNDEKEIFELLKKCSKREDEFKITELNKYAKTNYNEYSNSINKFINSARNSLYNLKLVDKNEQSQYYKAENAGIKLGTLKFLLKASIVGALIGFIPFINMIYIQMLGIAWKTNFISILLILLPLIIVLIMKFKTLIKNKGKIAVLTQEGAQEKEQWRALVAYMEDFSKFEEKGVPDLILWEQYLVFATALGIADKVIEQMKAKYPEVFVKEYWEDEQNKNIDYSLIEFVASSTINIRIRHSIIETLTTETARAYKTSAREIASRASSSGGGRRRRLLIWRRWWRPEAAEWAEDKTF